MNQNSLQNENQIRSNSANRRGLSTDNKNNQNLKQDLEFSNAKTLLISLKRPKSFLERTIRELHAGGTEIIILSALGEAISLCVLLLTTLQKKRASEIIKIETTYNPYRYKYNYGNPSHRPGLKIYIRKHPEFKGARISPGYVCFQEIQSQGQNTCYSPIYDKDPKERFGSVVSGDESLSFEGEGIAKEFRNILISCGQPLDQFPLLHEHLLKKALEINEGKSDSEVRAVRSDCIEELHPGLKFSMCRPMMKSYDDNASTGAIFISIFKENFPYYKENNMALVYVVTPNGEKYASGQDFLSDIYSTALNLMTALCDYNGLVRREGSTLNIQRINICRICLFGGGHSKHPAVTKKQIAESIFGGLNEGYRHGPSPRIDFHHDDNLFKQTWSEITGLEPNSLRYDGATDMIAN